MDKTEDDDFDFFCLKLWGERRTLFRIRLFGNAPKSISLQMKITKWFWVVAGALMNSMVLVQSHFLGGITSKQFAMLLAMVDQASTDAKAGIL
jgi:hypothetical protein